jgi:Tfp pilus assembly protein PilV
MRGCETKGTGTLRRCVLAASCDDGSEPVPFVSQPQAMSSPARRQGMVLIVVIVLLVVATLTFLSVAGLMARYRRQLHRQQWQAQASWLVESGLERAAARLAADPKYSGETWRISPDDFAGSDAAAVEIRVEPVAGAPGRRRVRVQADYPDDPVERARDVKQWTIEIPKGKIK